MKLRRVYVRNYREFRSTFEENDLAKAVLVGLSEIVESQIQDEKAPHVNLFLLSPYKDDGDAIFEVKYVRVLPDNTVIIDVDYTGTVS